MYNEITVDRSLFYIEQMHVDAFRDIANKMSEFSYIVKDGGLSVEDAWIVAFNTWLALLPDDYNMILSVDNSLYYSANIIIYNAVVEDIHFQYMKHRHDATPELIYLASLFLASGLNQWIKFVMNKYHLEYMIEKNRIQKYFDALKGTKEEIQTFVEDQALFVKAAIQELKTDSFTKTIKKSCDDAYFLYLDHVIK